MITSWGLASWTILQIAFLDASTHVYKRLCSSVHPLVRWSVGEHESKCVKTHISAPAHSSATGGRVSGLVFFSFQLFFCQSSTNRCIRVFMTKLFVFCQLNIASKASRTDVTTVWFFTRVRFSVTFQQTAYCKSRRAKIAFVWLFTSVSSSVGCKSTASGKMLWAQLTFT